MQGQGHTASTDRLQNVDYHVSISQDALMNQKKRYGADLLCFSQNIVTDLQFPNSTRPLPIVLTPTNLTDSRKIHPVVLQLDISNTTNTVSTSFAVHIYKASKGISSNANFPQYDYGNPAPAYAQGFTTPPSVSNNEEFRIVRYSAAQTNTYKFTLLREYISRIISNTTAEAKPSTRITHWFSPDDFIFNQTNNTNWVNNICFNIIPPSNSTGFPNPTITFTINSTFYYLPSDRVPHIRTKKWFLGCGLPVLHLPNPIYVEQTYNEIWEILTAMSQNKKHKSQYLVNWWTPIAKQVTADYLQRYKSYLQPGVPLALSETISSDDE